MNQQKFINREKELAFLKEAYSSKKSEFIVLYGRRRIGKSELITEFIKKKKGIYFLASTEGDKNNIHYFKERISQIINDKSLENIEIKDWLALFRLLFSNIKFQEIISKHKFIIAIDEFPFLIQGNKSILSTFQKIWELILKNKNIMLILSGSSVSVMEDKVLGYKSPIFGRRTGQWELQQLSFKHLKYFFKNYNFEDLIQIWFVLGGVPGYLIRFNKNLSFWDNLRDNLFKKGCYLYKEVEILLREEFREPKNYLLILKAIAMGKQTSGEICNFTGLDKGMVSRYLEILKNTHIIKEEIPVTASIKFRKRLFLLSDSYFDFWFRYIYPNKIELEAHNVDEVLSTIRADYKIYSGFMFERLIASLIKEKLILKDFKFNKAGRWWHKDHEIDLVTLNKKEKQITFCEFKWQEKVDAKKVFLYLKEKAKRVDWEKDRKEFFVIIAKSFKEKIKEKNLRLMDLKDLEKQLH